MNIKFVTGLRTKRTLLLKSAFGLILAGFVFGYTGGVTGNVPCILLAFILWGLAGTAALMIKK